MICGIELPGIWVSASGHPFSWGFDRKLSCCYSFGCCDSHESHMIFSYQYRGRIIYFFSLRSLLEIDSGLFNRLIGELSVLETLKNRSQRVVYSNLPVSDRRGSPPPKQFLPRLRKQWCHFPNYSNQRLPLKLHTPGQIHQNRTHFASPSTYLGPSQ